MQSWTYCVPKHKAAKRHTISLRTYNTLLVNTSLALKYYLCTKMFPLFFGCWQDSGISLGPVEYPFSSRAEKGSIRVVCSFTVGKPEKDVFTGPSRTISVGVTKIFLCFAGRKKHYKNYSCFFAHSAGHNLILQLL